MRLILRVSVLTALCLVALAASHLQADVLVSYSPYGYSGDGANVPLPPVAVADGIAATDLLKGPNNSGYDNAISSTNFWSTFFTPPTPDLSTSVASNLYFGFTITAQSGPATLSGFNFNNYFSAPAGPITYYLEDSISGFGTDPSNILASISNPGNEGRLFEGPGEIDFSQIQNLTAGESVEFRFYVASPNGGFIDFGIGDQFGFDTMDVLGTVAASVPEPSTYALLLSGSLVLLLVSRRVRSCR